MPTRALGALLAAVAAVVFVVSIVTSAWWNGHPRVDGHVFSAKDVHIGLLGGEGCNTGGTGECQPLELGATFTTAAYGELGAIGLATAFAILVAAAAWRVSDGRKRIARLAIIVTAIAAAGALVLIVIGPQIKSTAKVDAPIGWGLLAFGGGILASIAGGLVTARVEREPLRLKTYAKPPDAPAFDVRELLQNEGLRPSAPMFGPGASGSLPGPAGPLGAPLVPSAPQLRPLYDVQGAVPAAIAPQLPQRAPTPIPRASAHQMAGLEPPELARASSEAQVTDPFLPPPPRSKPVTAPPPFVPAAAPYGKVPTIPPPIDRNKPKTMPPPLRGRAPSVAPFAVPAIDRSKSPSVAPPSIPTVQAGIDPLGKTMPAPGKGRPSVPMPAKPGPKTAPMPTPTPSIVTSAPKPRPSQPTLAHAVPPMPQIDTPPPQLRAPTESDDSLETGMRETEAITAVEVDHEAKALFEEQRRAREGRAETAAEAEPTGISEPPIHDVPPAEDTDSVQTTGRERVELEASEPVAPPPAAAPVKPPLSTAPASLPPPKTANIAASGPTPACPQCESPMAWVEEHLRFYCKSCRMYF
jgi:hypothetical protein